MDSEGGSGVAMVLAAEEQEEETTKQASAAAAGSEQEEAPGGDDEMDRSQGRIDLLMLDNSQLQRLALVLRNREVGLMQQKNVINSEQERVQYLRIVNDWYAATLKLTDDSTALRDAYNNSGVRGQAARDVQEYVTYGLNACLQNVRNPCMRLDAVGKLREHYDALAEALADPGVDTDELAAEAAEYKAVMWQYGYSQRSATARAKSRSYSDALKLQGIDFEELVRRHQLRLGYPHTKFEDLEDDQKLEVYNSIIDDSGRAQVPVRMHSAGGGGGRKVSAKTWGEALGVFIMAAGTLTWDVFTAEYGTEDVLRASLNVLTSLGAFAVEVAVGAAVNKAIVGAGVFACSLAGFVVGAIAGLIFVAVSGVLIDLILRKQQVPQLADLKFHTAVMPDGMALAWAIAH